MSPAGSSGSGSPARLGVMMGSAPDGTNQSSWPGAALIGSVPVACGCADVGATGMVAEAASAPGSGGWKLGGSVVGSGPNCPAMGAG
jgi:hypothetical protein